MLVYIDGSSRGNPGKASAAVLIFDDEGNKIKEIKKDLGEATNNIAEYCAAIIALIELIEYRDKKITIHTDSELLVKQLKGDYAVRSQQLIYLNFVLKALCEKFEDLEFVYLTREQNKLAHDLLFK